jgi:hypothetical protein
MARNKPRPVASAHRDLAPLQTRCPACDQPSWVAYHTERTLMTLDGLLHLTLSVRRCRNPHCALFQQPYRPEAEGALALPHSEVGLEVIALVGALRYAEQRSVPEIHAELARRGIALAERTVTNLLHRYEELVSLYLGDPEQQHAPLRRQGRVLLALDGLQPDVGHEVLWVLRDCLSGQVLLARSLLGASEADLAQLLREVAQRVPVPIAGVISDGQLAIRKAVHAALPGVPHQLCQFHDLREATRPFYEADRHAKKELKKQVRGIRRIEHQLAGRSDPEARAMRAYCSGVRSALTDDGRPPLVASGLRLVDRLEAIHASLEGVAQKRGCRTS